MPEPANAAHVSMLGERGNSGGRNTVNALIAALKAVQKPAQANGQRSG